MVLGVTVHHGREGMAAQAGGDWSYCDHNQEAERGACMPGFLPPLHTVQDLSPWNAPPTDVPRDLFP